MKFSVLLFLTLLSTEIYPQKIKIDTLVNAVATVNTFKSIPVVGKTSSGGLYGAGLNFNYTNDGKPLPLQFARIDFQKKIATYKILDGVLSANGAFWMATSDQTGNVYISLTEPVRQILKFDLKDSIQYIKLGNAFMDGKSFAYSISLGRDGKMYFGGCSGATYWSSFDPKTNTWEKHPPIDNYNDYTLSIAGDSDYVYAQTGQRNSVQLWSIRKRDEQKKLLVKITNTTRINLDTRQDGIYASFNSDTLKGLFKLVKGDIVRISIVPDSKKITPVLPNVISVFDAVKDRLFYSINNQPFDSLKISATQVPVNIRRLFSFPKDTLHLFFVGDYYGNYYQYNLKYHNTTLLGSTGYNVYSSLPLNDSIMFFGGYPSGYLMKWNRNQPWTTQKFVSGKLVAATDVNANPKIMGYWKSTAKPPAGFHHTEQLLFDEYKNIVGAGDVIRIGNGASIGVYDIAKDSMYGVSYNEFEGMGYRSIARWGKFILYSMGNHYGKMPKLYYYNSAANKMTDSLDLGFDDYGNIFIDNNVLYGIASDRIYKIDLLTEKIIAAEAYPKNSIPASYFLSKGKAIVNTKIKISSSILQIIPMDYQNYYRVNKYVYATSGKNLIRITGLIDK